MTLTGDDRIEGISTPVQMTSYRVSHHFEPSILEICINKTPWILVAEASVFCDFIFSKYYHLTSVFQEKKVPPVMGKEKLNLETLGLRESEIHWMGLH